ncbi:alpha/beta hydrolase [Patescibacteria group bacterium]|nr:alpha/beta hydrolase [Patescibacteria group bacterium]
MNKRVIIIHGWGGSPQNGWMPWAKLEFENRGYEVIVPAMPLSDYPKIENWIPCLGDVIGKLQPTDILIGHSMGCQAILRFLERKPKDQKVGKVILVAGFGRYLTGLTEEEQRIAQPWLDVPLDLDKVKTKADSFIAIFSDNDPFVPLEKNKKLFEEKLGAQILIEHSKRHFNEDSLPVLLDYLF